MTSKTLLLFVPLARQTRLSFLQLVNLYINYSLTLLCDVQYAQELPCTGVVIIVSCEFYGIQHRSSAFVTPPHCHSANHRY